MKRQDLHTLSNFDFLARSFAHRHALGVPVNISAITGNMNAEQKSWFEERYRYYCIQEERTKVHEQHNKTTGQYESACPQKK
ncbi:hypothetical protein F384_12755 [Citrobacter amalonaticus Y19]|uniref:Surface composition regulator n=1 Tax=Citrobacter amalonaticus Y19 TaxID=1261127 RepID=A0A0F6RFR6_CITAM|nr:hypothetical protein [Citrobacter amalonaticus]AKE59373.1 hypothetical protein F384_12755 [Citrobacter amalonaticus Y19]